MVEYKKIYKFEATRNPSRWIITTLMDLESLNAAVKLMFDSTSKLWPAVQKTGLWKNKFYFDFKFGVCEQVLAERVNRYNEQVHEEPDDGLEKANIEAVVQIYTKNRYLLKTKCYNLVLCEDDALCLLKWLNNSAAPKTESSRTPLLRDCDAMIRGIIAAINGRCKDENIFEIAKQAAAKALAPVGFGTACSPLYQNLVSLHKIVDTPSILTDTNTTYNVHYIKDPVWSMNNTTKTEVQTKNYITQVLIFNKGDKNPYHSPCCTGYGFELRFAKPVFFENNGNARRDVIDLISKACDLCKPSWLQKHNGLTFYEIWPNRNDLLSIEILPGCDVKWPSEAIAKETRDRCLQKVIELFNCKSAYPTEIKITETVVPTVSINTHIRSIDDEAKITTQDTTKIAMTNNWTISYMTHRFFNPDHTCNDEFVKVKCTSDHAKKVQNRLNWAKALNCSFMHVSDVNPIVKSGSIEDRMDVDANTVFVFDPEGNIVYPKDAAKNNGKVYRVKYLSVRFGASGLYTAEDVNVLITRLNNAVSHKDKFISIVRHCNGKDETDSAFVSTIRITNLQTGEDVWIVPTSYEPMNKVFTMKRKDYTQKFSHTEEYVLGLLDRLVNKDHFEDSKFYLRDLDRKVKVLVCPAEIELFDENMNQIWPNVKSKITAIQVSQNVKAKSLLSRIMH